MPNSDPGQRVSWYGLVRQYLEEKGIAWTTWDYTGGFGLFEKGGNALFEHDLNVPLLEALDFNVPQQTEYIPRPDTEGFDLYTDYLGPNVAESSSAGGGTIDYYCATDPVQGQYCIYWTGSGQYSQIGFNFKPDKDLSTLVRQGYAVDFWIRGDSPGSKLDIRFVDTKTGPADHPWRMRMKIDQGRAAWDGAWHHVRIPLADFREHGSWDNGWFNPQGLFDWTAVDRFEIVSEYHALEGMQFWFDDIRVVGPH
jgi:endoglucanase